MKMRMLVAVLSSLCVGGSASALPILLDIDSTQGDTPLITQEGFTSYDAGSGPAGTPPQGSIDVDGVVLTLFGGLDGSRHRATGGGGEFDAVLRDFVFNDGAGAAVGLRVENLPLGLYDVTSWHYDAGGGITGTLQVEVRNPGGQATILADEVPFSTEPINYQIEVDEEGEVLELIFREDDALNRSRLNGIVIQVVPEPATAGVLLLGMLGLGLRRRRR